VNRVLLFTALLLSALFAAGLARLFMLRFEKGDVYPPYSTLRTDPLGAKAYYDSLAEIPGLDVRRNYRNGVRWNAYAKEDRNAALDEDRDDTPKHTYSRQALVLLGTPVAAVEHMDPAELGDLDGWIRRGGRLVIAFNDAQTTRRSETQTESSTLAKSLFKEWGVKRGTVAVDTSSAALAQEDALTEPGLPWHATLCFEALTDGWRTCYTYRGKAVVIERPLGAGSLVLCADSYVFSNEALRAERRPQLLAWAAGEASRITFDETHLGVVRGESVGGLARKYGLHGVVFALLVLAALYVWRGSVSFVPRNEEQDTSDAAITGAGHGAGLANLLRRHVRPAELLGVCLTQWTKSCARKPELARKLPRMEEAARAPQDPSRCYEELCRIVAER